MLQPTQRLTIVQETCGNIEVLSNLYRMVGPCMSGHSFTPGPRHRVLLLLLLPNQQFDVNDPSWLGIGPCWFVPILNRHVHDPKYTKIVFLKV
jgi:hypothetical protein